jgi:hypothetical protein
MEFEYLKSENNILLDNLKNEVVKKTLAYMVDFKEHENLVVTQKPYSIEISNEDICIAVIIFVGFEKEEYESLKSKKNHHIVSFDTILQTMFEFENMPIKYIDYMALLFMSLSRTNDATIKDFLRLKNLCGNQTIYHLKKGYILKDVVWNQDLFDLLYKRKNINTDCKIIKNKFSATMVLNGILDVNDDHKLKNIGSSFIQEFNKKRDILVENTSKTNLDKRKSLLVGFGVASDNGRAKKAIQLALSPFLINDRLLYKSIQLLISSCIIEISLDEIGTINDYIQEKSDYNADIVMDVNVDENLGEALAVTIILAEQ